MQKGLREYNLKLFDGIRNYEENNAVGLEKLYNGRNVRFRGYKISSKKNYVKLGDRLTGGGKFQGLYEYEFSNAGSDELRLISFYNGSFYQFDESTQLWSAISTTWPSVANDFTDGVNYYNNMYFVNPMLSNVSGVGKIEDGTFSVIADSPRGYAIESWVERLWIIGDESARNAVIASKAANAANPGNVEIFDTADGAILELVGKGGRAVAIRVLDNNLFVWKRDSIWYNTPENIAQGNTQFIELSRTGGAINQKSTIVVENDIWFLTPSLEIRSLGLERNLGTNPRTKDLTDVISRTMSTDNLDPVQDNPIMSYHNREVKLHLKTKGSATNNITIVFDYDTGGFSIDRGQAVNLAVVWNNNLTFTLDGGVGQAFIDNSGYSAAGAPYAASADTPFIDDNRPDSYKRARYLYIRGKQSYDQEIKVILYRGGDYSTYSEYTIPSPRARGVSQSTPANDGPWGNRQQGDSQWGGDEISGTLPLYRLDYKISLDRKSNMFALGFYGIINGGAYEIEQAILKIIDQRPSYRRSDY